MLKLFIKLCTELQILILSRGISDELMPAEAGLQSALDVSSGAQTAQHGE